MPVGSTDILPAVVVDILPAVVVGIRPAVVIDILPGTVVVVAVSSPVQILAGVDPAWHLAVFACLWVEAAGRSVSCSEMIQTGL